MLCISVVLPSMYVYLLSDKGIDRQTVRKGKGIIPVVSSNVTHFTILSFILNIRSLAGKTFLINDFIIEHNLDFKFLT